MNIWKHRLLQNTGRVSKTIGKVAERASSYNSASFGCKYTTLLGNFYSEKFQLP